MSDTEEQAVPTESQEEATASPPAEEQQEEQQQPAAGEEEEEEATPTPPVEEGGEEEQQEPEPTEEPTAESPAAADTTPQPEEQQQEEEEKEQEQEPAQAEAAEEEDKEKEAAPPPPAAADAAEEPTQEVETPAATEEEEEPPAKEEKEEEEGGEKEGEGDAAVAAEAEEQGEAEQSKDEPEVEEEAVVEEPVVISPEGNPHWLPVDEVLAKGLPESEVDNFRHFYFKQAYSLQKWYEALKDFVFPTEFITLSKEEIDALSAEGDPSEEQQQVLAGLEERINNVIELFEGDGALVRVNSRSPKDAILDNSEESFVAQVRDAVNNEQEVEKQAVCAYAIWQDQEKHPGVFKRGLSKIRESMRRKRAHSTSKRPKLEEEKKEDDGESKPAEEGEGKKEEAGDGGDHVPPPEEGGGEAAAEGGEVTVDVTVEGEGGGDTTEETRQETPPATEEPKAEDAPAATTTTTSEEPTIEDGPKTEETSAEETEQPKPKEEEEEVTESKPTEEGEGDKKEEGGEDEIQKIEEDEKKEDKKEQPKVKPEPKRKMKPESLDNQLVRAFGRATGALYCVKSGKEAIDMLRKSAAVRRDLNQLKAFSGVEGVLVSLSVTRWQTQVTQYAGMVFRGFVYQNELRALSQYNDTAFYPKVAYYKATIQAKVVEFYNTQLKEALAELDSFVVDFYVAPDRVYVARLSPFYTNVGACLFTWTEHGRILTQGPFELRVVETAKTAPECYNAFQGHWQTMFENMLEQKRVQRRPRAGCVLL